MKTNLFVVDVSLRRLVEEWQDVVLKNKPMTSGEWSAIDLPSLERKIVLTLHREMEKQDCITGV